MPKQRKAKPTIEKSKSRNIVVYVENSTPRGKVFTNAKSMMVFVNKFNKMYPKEARMNDGYWIDLIITDIKGEITDVQGEFGINGP
jgi:hypothetical protein